MKHPTFHPVLTLTVVAAAAITATRRFVGFDGKLAAAGAKALGTNPVTADLGEHLPVDAIGTILVESGGAITQGAEVEADDQARAVPLGGGKSNGWALDAAQGAGELIRIARGI